jgi:hypothetical protein
MTNEIALIPVSDIERMASAVAASKLFGVTSKEQAMSLMLIAQAEGTHPALAARDYHIIQGRPALKSDAMLARFQAAGGRVEWHDYTDAKVSATFSHPSGGSATIDWDIKRATNAQLGGKDMWRKFPRQMLRARVISEGIRTVFPGVVSGFYAPEEVVDFDDKPRPMRDVTPRVDEAPDTQAVDAKKLAERFDAAKKFIESAKDEAVLSRITASNNYKALLADLDGDERKDALVSLTAGRMAALTLEPESEIPAWMNDSAVNGGDNA